MGHHESNQKNSMFSKIWKYWSKFYWIIVNHNTLKSGVLIATDIASRGLDFSDVDWVVQMDAPATVDDYIHRYKIWSGSSLYIPQGWKDS